MQHFFPSHISKWVFYLKIPPVGFSVYRCGKWFEHLYLRIKHQDPPAALQYCGRKKITTFEICLKDSSSTVCLVLITHPLNTVPERPRYVALHAASINHAPSLKVFQSFINSNNSCIKKMQPFAFIFQATVAKRNIPLYYVVKKRPVFPRSDRLLVSTNEGEVTLFWSAVTWQHYMIKIPRLIIARVCGCVCWGDETRFTAGRTHTNHRAKNKPVFSPPRINSINKGEKTSWGLYFQSVKMLGAYQKNTAITAILSN